MGRKSTLQELCPKCKVMPLSKPYSVTHDYMASVSERRSKSNNTFKRLYQCRVCESLWLHEKDKWDACLGFKFWHGTIADFNRQYAIPQPAPIIKYFKGPVRYSPGPS